jgi:hypothetical protein
MIRVGVREQNGVELGQGIERDSGSAHPRKKPAERGIEVGVSE